MTLALIVKVTHSWASGMIVIGAAAACGALLWLFVHPERPLLGDEPAGPLPPAETGAATESVRNAGASRHDARETDADAGEVSEHNS
ncbi:hypothetical protein M3I53_05830 [Paraburkholderia sp. CNPSo 3272]|uniref:hypothetical protein n=1 Tax=Paraburkholderia sp. CNPSo 3272 TaxID=2940931 RepID=UPI0020B67DAA|nr:hypothetical protein [Paraburkholderia sp. CNPSo 3272]MCP3722655.1 hypothetical protein [Paraburkholderia sp. CNPSo 3272]